MMFTGLDWDCHEKKKEHLAALGEFTSARFDSEKRKLKYLTNEE